MGGSESPRCEDNEWDPVQVIDESEGRKKRPRVAGGGENLPLEILRCLSEWVSVLDERETVPGKRLHFERRSIS